MANQSRRAFMGKVLAGTAGVGAIASLYAMKRTWDPLPSVMSAGFTTVDLAPLKPGHLSVIKWRGKPIFLLRHDEGTTPDDSRDIVTSNGRYTVVIGLCTHLGCIPEWKRKEQKFKCACHGGEYDVHANETFGPPPRPMDIPPFSQKGSTIVLGEEGPEYKKLVAAQKA